MNTTNKYIYESDIIDFLRFRDSACYKINVFAEDYKGNKRHTAQIKLDNKGQIKEWKGNATFWTTLPTNVNFNPESIATEKRSMPLLKTYSYGVDGKLVEINACNIINNEPYSKHKISYVSNNIYIVHCKESHPNHSIEINEKFFYNKDSKLIKRIKEYYDKINKTETNYIDKFIYNSRNLIVTKNTTQSCKWEKIDLNVIAYSETTYLYNKHYQLDSALERWFSKNDDEEQIFNLTFKYSDEKSDRIKEVLRSDGNLEKTRTEFEYDKKNRVEKVINSDLKNNRKTITRYERE